MMPQPHTTPGLFVRQFRQFGMTLLQSPDRPDPDTADAFLGTVYHAARVARLSFQAEVKVVREWGAGGRIVASVAVLGFAWLRWDYGPRYYLQCAGPGDAWYDLPGEDFEDPNDVTLRAAELTRGTGGGTVRVIDREFGAAVAIFRDGEPV